MVVSLIGVWPYRSILHHYPWKVDAVKWVVRGATDRPGWAEWVFGSTHFVGYRPVAALSYSVTYWLDGWGPVAYRATDMLLFALAAVAVAALFRVLVGRPDVWMVVAALLFVSHPVAHEIVPFLARRSYTLAVLFSSAGLAIWLAGVREEGRGRVVLGAALLFAGLLSNEVAFVVVPLIPAFAYAAGLHLRSSLRRAAPVGVAAVVAVALRFAVVGAGGYDERYFAMVEEGRKTLVRSEGLPRISFFGAALDYAWFPVGMSGSLHPFRAVWTWGQHQFEAPGRVLLAIVVAYYLWRVVVEPLLDRDRDRALGVILAFWCGGLAMLYAFVQTWFWRQALPMIVPLSLLVALQLRRTVRARRWLELLPQLLLVGGLLWHSPVVRGMSNYKMEGRIQANRFLAELPTLIEALEPDTRVVFVVPGHRGTFHTTRGWLKRLFPDRGLRFLGLGYGLPPEGLVERGEGELHLGAQVRLLPSIRRRYPPRGHALPYEELLVEYAPSVLIRFDAAEGRWVREDLP